MEVISKQKEDGEVKRVVVSNKVVAIPFIKKQGRVVEDRLPELNLRIRVDGARFDAVDPDAYWMPRKDYLLAWKMAGAILGAKKK